MDTPETKKTDLSDVLSAESAAELSSFHHHDGVMVEPHNNLLRFGRTGNKKTDLSDVFSAESAAELSCLHHYDGVMVEPLDNLPE